MGRINRPMTNRFLDEPMRLKFLKNGEAARGILLAPTALTWLFKKKEALKLFEDAASSADHRSAERLS